MKGQSHGLKALVFMCQVHAYLKKSESMAKGSRACSCVPHSPVQKAQGGGAPPGRLLDLRLRKPRAGVEVRPM